MELKNKRNFLLLIVFIVAILGTLYFRMSGSSLKLIEDKNDKVSDFSKKNLIKSKSSVKLESTDSLRILGKTFANIISNEVDINMLMDELEGMQLAPSRVEDKNEYTGNMSIIRTGKNLTGTRYFHAQFFSNDNGGHDLQHLSFDYQGDKADLARVAQNLAQYMKIKSTPEISRAEYRKYRVNDKYIFWAKIFDKGDYINMKSHPYKAYTENDIGEVILVALEQEIH